MANAVETSSSSETMNHNLKVDENCTHVCRACLKKLGAKESFCDVFQRWAPPWDGMQPTIAEDITKLTNVKISKTDKHSHIICYACYVKLLQACQFIKCVQLSDLQIQQKMWPGPIQVDKQGVMDIDVPRIKEELLSDEENAANDCEPSQSSIVQTDLENMEIKIEPEEFVQPSVSAVKGETSLDPELRNSDLPNSELMNTQVINMNLSRTRKILQQAAIRNKEKSSGLKASTSNSIYNLPTTSNHTYPSDNENLCENRDGHFSLASENLKICRRSSSSSSSSSNCSSSSSSRSSKSSVSFSTSSAPGPLSTNIRDNNLEFVNDITETISYNQDSRNVDGYIVIDIEPAVDSNYRSAGNVVTDIVVDISPVAGNTDKLKKNQSVALVSRALKDSEKEYISSAKTKNVIPARFPKQTCESTCRLKCSERITEELRLQIFNDYCGMTSLVRQREFIAHNIDEIIPKYQYKKADSNRKFNNAFYFYLNGARTRVCKTFFKNTLDITDSFIRTVIKKMRTTGVLIGEKKRQVQKST